MEINKSSNGNTSEALIQEDRIHTAINRMNSRYNSIKKVIIVSLFFVFMSPLSLMAQADITLTFIASSQLDSVRIDNLNNKNFEVVTDGIFEIIFDTVKVDTVVLSSLAPDDTAIYPNPFYATTNFDFISQSTQTIDISVHDMSGSQLIVLTEQVEKGHNYFKFRPVCSGVYFLKVRSDSDSGTHKMICLEGDASEATIELSLGSSNRASPPQVFANNTARTDVQVEAQDEFLFAIDDLLRFTAYSASQVETKYDFLSSSKKYEFGFDRHFKIQHAALQSRIPGLIDVVFAVTDSLNSGIDFLTSDHFKVKENNEGIQPDETYQNIRTSAEIPMLMKTVLLLDNSMNSASNLAAFKKAANKLVTTLRENQEIAVFAFSDSAILMTDFINNKLNLEYWINSIDSEPEKGANLLGSLSKPLSNWEDRFDPSGVVLGSLIVFSGGNDESGTVSLADALQTRGNKRIYGITYDGERDETLEAISDSGKYFLVDEENELESAIVSIQADIIQYANSVYALNYLSPQRSGVHSVAIEISDNSNTNPSAIFSGMYNADGFTSADQGVFLNPSDTSIYGLDTIRSFVRRPDYFFSTDHNEERFFSMNQIVLRPVTYGGAEAPDYTWELSSDDAFKIEATPEAPFVLFPKSMARDTVTITLRDASNGFSKNIIYIMNPPEFFEEMQIEITEFTDSRLDEISGIAASIKYPNHFWVHNDSGDDAHIYLVNTNGKTIARVLIKDITSRDWEDITIGPGPVEGVGYIYVADIGDNGADNTYKYIYRIPEPDIDTTSFNQNRTVLRSEVSAFTFTYADGPRDAEILMIEPESKDLYIVTKRESQVQIYTMPFPQMEADTLNLVKSSVTLPFRLTNGGDISADGQEILIKNLENVFYWKREPGETIIDALARPATSLPYEREPQGEAITWFRDGSAFVTVSEREPILYLYKR